MFLAFSMRHLMNKPGTNLLSYMLQTMKHIAIILIILYIISIVLLQMNMLPSSIANIVNHIKSVEITVISIIGLSAYIWKLSRNLITIIFDAIIAIILIVFVLRPPLPFPLYP